MSSSQPTSNKPVVGFSMGDPNGIGPEILLKLADRPDLLKLVTPVFYASGHSLKHYADQLDYQLSLEVLEPGDTPNPKRFNLVECAPNFNQLDTGKPTPQAGEAAYLSLARATEDAREDKLDVLVTLPIHKFSIQREEFPFPGHTEYLAHVTGAKNRLMILAEQDLRVALVTGHMPLQEVPGKLNHSIIFTKIELLNSSLQVDFSLEKPRIAVLGLNPHAGDNGLLGSEEQEHIRPALDQARKKNMLALGPYPADGFFASGQYRQFDAVLAMYHDQGLAPFKALSAHNGVNFTAGLPIVRTSPDHGTAFDIAGRGVARIDSTLQAVYMGVDIARRRRENLELLENSLHKSKQHEHMQRFFTGEDQSAEA